MNKIQIPVYEVLTYLGLIPFVFLALGIAHGQGGVLEYFDLNFFLYSYALAVICFICGSHWSMFLHNSNSFSRIMLIASNLITLTAWLAISLKDKNATIAVYVVCLIILAVIEAIFLNKNLITRRYFQTRIIATSIACISLITVSTKL
jgi:hypothetical protein